MTDNANLYAAFEAAFPSDLDKPLLITATGNSLSYAAAIEGCGRLANALLGTGASPGDRVTVQVSKSVDNLLLYLACLRAGLVYHPLNTAYLEDELRFFVGNAEPSLVVCQPEKAALFAGLMKDHSKVYTLAEDGSGSLMNAAKQQPIEADTYVAAADDMAALLYSSGTTGRPKGIMLTHQNLHSSATTLVQQWGFNEADCLLHALPIYHVHGLFVALGCTLLSGSSMRWHNNFDAAAVISDLPECTVMMGVPTFYTRLLSLPEFGRQHCTSMRLFISGSAPMLTDTFEVFEDRTGHRILERYGMSETSMNTSNPLNGERKPGTVGPALPGVSVRVVDDGGKELPVGEPGNLQVKGSNVFPGYWRLPEKTAEDFTDDGFFDTGDKASIDCDGYVSIVGRAKDMIISGGLNVYPKEVELLIDEISGVTESAVIGIPHPDFGEAVMAVVVAKAGAVQEEAVIAFCRERLAAFKCPKQVVVVDTLPRNAMGKVQKNLLRQQYGEQ